MGNTSTTTNPTDDRPRFDPTMVVQVGGGQDRGAQFMMANPLNPGAFLLSRDFSKERISDGTITYWATVVNIGSFNTNFRWQGGGLV